MKGNGTNIHELTRIEAYLLSEKAGHPSHMHDYFWAQAEAIVRQRVAIVDFAVKTSGGKASKTGKAAKAKPKPVSSKAKMTPEAQLPLGDVTTTAKPTVAASKTKTAAPAKKKVAEPLTKPKPKSASKLK